MGGGGRVVGKMGVGRLAKARFRRCLLVSLCASSRILCNLHPGKDASKGREGGMPGLTGYNRMLGR